MQSYWSVMCVAPHHGNFLKKLERLAHFSALEVESERVIFNDEKVQCSTFLVRHQATSWNELVLELLGTAKGIVPVWKMTIETQSISGETSQNVGGPNVEYQMPLTGLRSLRWSINATQQYTRTKWLNGQPDHW
jgi:hypothetical protein